MDSKAFFQNCPATIIAIAGSGKKTTAAMLATIFNTYFATTDLGDKAHMVAETGDSAHNIARDLDVLSDISNIDIVLYILSDSQLEHMAVNVPYLIIGQTTDPNTNQAAIRSTNLVAEKAFYLGRDLNSYTLANRTMAPEKSAFPDDLPFKLTNLQVVGDWQHECAAAAALVATKFPFTPGLIQSALANFAELPHHLDFIREVNGVKYYDDSVSTTPELAVVSIRTFNRPVIISAVKFPDQLVKRQIIIPRGVVPGGAPSQDVIVGDPLIDRADTLADATALASIFAENGDVVLFVPAAPNIPPEEFVMEVNKL
jgi:UDP-N-acetylmuramoylalanine-D-glutamate ligase